MQTPTRFPGFASPLFFLHGAYMNEFAPPIPQRGQPASPALLLAAFLGLVLASPAAAQTRGEKPTGKKAGPLAQVEDVEGLPRVLLIGDSISMGYTLPVRKFLEGKANVHRPPVNCGPTTRGLEGIDEWLDTGGAGKKWDLIHFNWGLHDLKYMGSGGENLADPEDSSSRQQVPPEEYRKNLQALVDRLRETGAVLIWRNTTPVPEGAKGRVVGDSAAYNRIAKKIMEKEEIAIQDLYSFALENQDELMRPANVHFTPAGSLALGREVAERIRKTLKLQDGSLRSLPDE